MSESEEQPRRKYGGPVLIKKGDVIPENAKPMTETEVLLIQERRVKNFTPSSEMRPFHFGTHIMAGTVAVSGLMINATVRRNFRLGGLRRMFTYVPTVVFPSVFTAAIHELGIKHRILLGKETCVNCISIRSGLYNASMGLVYPVLISVLACLPIAREYYTLPMPGSSKGYGLIQLLRNVMPPSQMLLGIGVANLIIGTVIAAKEMQVYYKHLSRPLSSQVDPSDAELLRD